MLFSQLELTHIILFAGIALGFAGIVFCIAQQNKLKRQLKSARQETYLLVKALRNEANAMGSGAIGVGQRLVEVEKRLNSTMERQMEIEQRDPGSIPYAYAVRLVEMGATTEELINNCGLARVEAELITLIHSELKSQKNNPMQEERYTLN